MIDAVQSFSHGCLIASAFWVDNRAGVTKQYQSGIKVIGDTSCVYVFLVLLETRY